MQRGKGGDGLTTGNNAGYFGSSGSGNLLTRLTTGLAIGFFVTCLTLGVMSAGA
ncbi:MAG: preprotein translocase subunit SecG [Candidatus Comchoanobacterales bacterium]